jgi:hypothetical protein
MVFVRYAFIFCVVLGFVILSRIEEVYPEVSVSATPGEGKDETGKQKAKQSDHRCCCRK